MLTSTPSRSHCTAHEISGVSDYPSSVDFTTSSTVIKENTKPWKCDQRSKGVVHEVYGMTEYPSEVDFTTSSTIIKEYTKKWKRHQKSQIPLFKRFLHQLHKLLESRSGHYEFPPTHKHQESIVLVNFRVHRD